MLLLRYTCGTRWRRCRCCHCWCCCFPHTISILFLSSLKTSHLHFFEGVEVVAADAVAAAAAAFLGCMVVVAVVVFVVLTLEVFPAVSLSPSILKKQNQIGGKMVYSTCSLNPIEDEAVVAEVLKRCGGNLELEDCHRYDHTLMWVPVYVSVCASFCIYPGFCDPGLRFWLLQQRSYDTAVSYNTTNLLLPETVPTKQITPDISQTSTHPRVLGTTTTAVNPPVACSWIFRFLEWFFYDI